MTEQSEHPSRRAEREPPLPVDLLPLVLDYDRFVDVARKRRRNLIVGLAVIAAVAGASGYLGACCCGIAQTFTSKWGNPSSEERVERILTGLVVAVLVASGIIIGGRSDESGPPSDDDEHVSLQHRR